SVLRVDFRPDSDVDVLVSFAPEAAWGLLDQVRMQMELEQALGRKVDLVSRRAIENSANWIRRQEILRTAQLVYPT
ncbi:MAG: nucleotidyltransferase family protein, partial [Blastocatellia bacterium]